MAASILLLGRIRSRTKLRKACREHFLNYLRMLEWQDVQRQLREITAGLGWRLNREPATGEQVHRAVIAALHPHQDPARAA